MSAGGLIIVADDEATIGEAVGRTLNLHGAVSKCSTRSPAEVAATADKPFVSVLQVPLLIFVKSPMGYRAVSTCGATSVLYAKSTCWYSCSQNSALS